LQQVFFAGCERAGVHRVCSGYHLAGSGVEKCGVSLGNIFSRNVLPSNTRMESVLGVAGIEAENWL